MNATKNTNQKGQNMKTTQTIKTQSYKDAVVKNIATDLLHIDTLEERKMDGLDFHNVAVWQVKKALEAAFEAGRQTKR